MSEVDMPCITVAVKSKVQTVFLDTCVILDYLENRDAEIRDIVAQLLLFHEKGKITLATSIFNIAELIDKEFEIHFIGHLVSERLSYDEIWKKKGNKRLFREISERNKEIIERRIKDFIIGKEICVLSPTFDEEGGEKELESYEELYRLIYEYQLSSQDALVVATALSNGVTYFLSNDQDLVKQINNNGLIDAYCLKDENQRKSFKNNVLDSLAEELG